MPTINYRHRQAVLHQSRQRGVVLYVAMIVLLLLTILGTAAMQVATLQQRMATNFNDFALAFHNAEGVLRQSEFDLQRDFDSALPRSYQYCATSANAWADAVEPEAIPTPSVRRLRGGALCASPAAGGDPMSPATAAELYFQIIVAAADRAATADPGAVVVVETTFLVPPQALPPPPPP